ncbi:hypothetical protein JCM8547_002691 [Rhodosporidiobolus lusitaniae]
MHSAQSPSPAVEGTGQRAVVQYDHDAQSGFELSVRENDPVLVLVPEDESGWVKVRDERDGREGLVPGSYLEIGSTGAAGGAGAGGAAAGGGGGRVVALYDYAAQAADELSLREGEEAELTAVGMGVGEGWAEITKNGQIGIVPSSYVPSSSRLPNSPSSAMGLNIVHWVGAFFLLAATALLIVASVSSPIWDSQGFLHGSLNGQHFVMGNWGGYVANMKSGNSLGYNKSFWESATGVANSDIIFSDTYSKVLILTPICAGLSFIALLFALSTHLVMGILASVMSLLAFIATAVSLGLDLGLFVVAKRRINNLANNSHASYGAMIWLVVAACACQLLASLTVCFTRSRRRRDATDREFAAVPAMRSTEPSIVDPRPSAVGSTAPMMNETTQYNHNGLTDSHSYHTSGTGVTGHYVEPTTNYEPTAAADNVKSSGHNWRA